MFHHHILYCDLFSEVEVKYVNDMHFQKMNMFQSTQADFDYCIKEFQVSAVLLLKTASLSSFRVGHQFTWSAAAGTGS